MEPRDELRLSGWKELLLPGLISLWPGPECEVPDPPEASREEDDTPPNDGEPPQWKWHRHQMFVQMEVLWDEDHHRQPYQKC
ncbi:MAG: hypothetical protein WAW92_03385 [Minisyncoccia bacterium]